MKSPQTTIRNEKNPTVLRGWVWLNIQNILVKGLKTAEATSNPEVNGVAYPKNENDSQVKSKAYSVPELAIFCRKINIAAGGVR